jgi:Type I restriction enzyme HindI endonuclease subunit-like, C-terminal
MGLGAQPPVALVAVLLAQGIGIEVKGLSWAAPLIVGTSRADAVKNSSQLTADQARFARGANRFELTQLDEHLLGDEALRTIARELVGTVRANVTIDWTVRDNVRAQLRVLARRILRKYGYPPDSRRKRRKQCLNKLKCFPRDGRLFELSHISKRLYLTVYTIISVLAVAALVMFGLLPTRFGSSSSRRFEQYEAQMKANWGAEVLIRTLS